MELKTSLIVFMRLSVKTIPSVRYLNPKRTMTLYENEKHLCRSHTDHRKFWWKLQ